MRNHTRIALAAAAIWLGAASSPASAQAQTYQCVNESIDVDVRPQNMAAALTELSRQTRCPISRDADISGLRGNGVRGTYTPVEALSALVEDQGLKAVAIHQGLSVTSAGGRRSGSADIDYNCQNQTQRVTLKAMPLDAALAELSRQTRCPISKDFQTEGLRSRAVKGSMTPVEALQAILKGTGLKAQMIKQGLAVKSARG